MSKLKDHLSNKKNYNVLVTILTDGLENASKEYSGIQINKIIKELTLSGWKFTYIGTGHEVTGAAATISINNTIYFDRDAKSINKMFVAEKSAREYFCLNLNDNRIKKQSS